MRWDDNGNILPVYVLKPGEKELPPAKPKQSTEKGQNHV